MGCGVGRRDGIFTGATHLVINQTSDKVYIILYITKK